MLHGCYFSNCKCIVIIVILSSCIRYQSGMLRISMLNLYNCFIPGSWASKKTYLTAAVCDKYESIWGRTGIFKDNKEQLIAWLITNYLSFLVSRHFEAPISVDVCWHKLISQCLLSYSMRTANVCISYIGKVRCLFFMKSCNIINFLNNTLNIHQIST